MTPVRVVIHRITIVVLILAIIHVQRNLISYKSVTDADRSWARAVIPDKIPRLDEGGPGNVFYHILYITCFNIFVI